MTTAATPPVFTATIAGPATMTAENLARTHLGDFVKAHPGFSAEVTDSGGGKWSIPAQGVAPSYAELQSQLAASTAQVAQLRVAAAATPAPPPG